jgi:malonyl-CoA O-methyltransferase
MRLLRRLFDFRPAPANMGTLASVEAYSQWANTYPPNAHNPLMQVEERAMLSLLLPLEGKHVLDVACGTGRYSLLAWDRGAARVLGVDNSLAMLRQNTLSHKALSSAEHLPIASLSIDVVICGLALGHLPRPDKAIGEIARVLRRGGYALISDFHPFMFLSGAQRTFTTNGSTYAVEHYPHLYADYHRAAWEAGLVIEQVIEPKLETPTPQNAHAQLPAVIVYRMIKP